MCLNCTSDDELSECAFDGDEHHPDDWPDDARREDYPDSYPEPKGWHDDSGKPYDSNWRRYNPWQGSQSPAPDRCSAPLTASEDRYGETRYCTRLVESDFVEDGSRFCHVHKNREPMIERASDVFSHGLYSKTIRHVFERLEPWQQLALLAWYDSYLQESVYDFGPEFETESIDFDDADDEDLPLEIVSMIVEGDDRSIDVGVPVPSEHRNRGYALYRAAVMDVKAGLAERAIFGSHDADTVAMERESTVSVTEEGREITDMDEHHLNLPLSRLDGDRKELLEFGGVIVSEDQDSIDVNVDSPDELVVDLDPDTQTTGDSNPVEQSMQNEQ